MIPVGTFAKTLDNSGALKVKVIRILRKNVGYVGDMCCVVVKKARPRKRVRKGEVHLAVIVRVSAPARRPYGQTLRFSQNAVVVLNKKRLPMGSRVLGSVFRELRLKKFMKVVSLASICI